MFTGGRKITIEEIAKLANTSKTTISRVLNNSSMVKEETRKRVLNVIAEQKYKPSSFAQSMRSKRSNTIGLILADIENPFYSRMAKGVINIAESEQLNVIICNSDYDTQSEEESIKKLIGRQIDGIIITTVLPNKDILKELQVLEIPFILVDCMVEIDGVSYILNDDYFGGRIAAGYLLSLGHKNIGFVGNKKILSFRKRYEGFKSILESNNLKTDIDFMIEDVNDFIGINTITRKIIHSDKGITALFAANDFLAIKVIDSFFSMGVKIPRDMSVIGYDNIPLSGTIRVPLTTINQLKYRLGKIAMKSLLKLIDKENKDKVKRIVMKPELVIRQSCIEI